MVNIVWIKPDPSWMKLNTDGVSKGNPGDAGCGGILRNEYGHWLRGFTYHIGSCSAYVAELWGIYVGLLFA